MLGQSLHLRNGNVRQGNIATAAIPAGFLIYQGMKNERKKVNAEDNVR